MVYFSEDDKRLLSTYGVKVEKHMPIFTKELYEYLKHNWSERFHEELEPLKNNDIDAFNKIIGFPGFKGFSIIDDSFTGTPKENSPSLSDTTRELIGWIYGIYLHY